MIARNKQSRKSVPCACWITCWQIAKGLQMWRAGRENSFSQQFPCQVTTKGDSSITMTGSQKNKVLNAVHLFLLVFKIDMNIRGKLLGLLILPLLSECWVGMDVALPSYYISSHLSKNTEKLHLSFRELKRHLRQYR